MLQVCSCRSVKLKESLVAHEAVDASTGLEASRKVLLARCGRS